MASSCDSADAMVTLSRLLERGVIGARGVDALLAGARPIVSMSLLPAPGPALPMLGSILAFSWSGKLTARLLECLLFCRCMAAAPQCSWENSDSLKLHRQASADSRHKILQAGVAQTYPLLQPVSDLGADVQQSEITQSSSASATRATLSAVNRFLTMVYSNLSRLHHRIYPSEP
eukprot:scpid18900/ scgid14890/ 